MVVLIAWSVTLGACDGDGTDFCATAGGALVPIDGPGSVVRWRALEGAADAEIGPDVTALRVVAQQIERLGDEADLESVTAIAVRPDVVRHHARVVAHHREICG